MDVSIASRNVFLSDSLNLGLSAKRHLVPFCQCWCFECDFDLFLPALRHHREHRKHHPASARPMNRPAINWPTTLGGDIPTEKFL